MFGKLHQTYGWQREVIRKAQQRGELHTLCWFVQGERELSRPQRRGMTPVQIVNAQYCVGAAPGNWTPYIPVGHQPWASREWADMLAQMFNASNDEWKFSPALCLWSELVKMRLKYEFGDDWDCICSVCGAVFPCHWIDFDICEECSG